MIQVHIQQLHVSIQPGYPPGMRFGVQGLMVVVDQVSIQPGYPPGMRSIEVLMHDKMAALFQSNPAIRRE